METVIQVAVLVPAALFTGVVLFLSTVLRRTFDALPPGRYHEVYSLVIRIGRRSVLISAIVLLPPVGLVAYLLLGYADPVFVAGTLVYVAGSLAASRLVNDPLYTRLLQADPAAADEVSRIRARLNRGNITRALVSLAGVALVAVAVA